MLAASSCGKEAKYPSWHRAARCRHPGERQWLPRPYGAARLKLSLVKTVDGTQKLWTVLQPSKTSPQPYPAGCALLHGSLLPALSCFSNSFLFYPSLAPFKYHTRKRVTIQTPAVTRFFCLQHCHACLPDRVFKPRGKKRSKLKKTSIQRVKKPHSQADNCSVQLQPAGENSLQIFTRQNMLTGSCLVLLLTISWK